jgi:L-fuculose-phosphate aldolase
VTDVPLEARTIPESYIFLRDVGRVPFGVHYVSDDAAGDATTSSDRTIADYVSPRSPAVLLENDGVLVVGTSILDAFDRLEVLETTAEAIINSRPIGSVSPMPESVIDELKAAFLGE